jgi:IMP dehydrogenase/GMP reductase
MLKYREEKQLCFDDILMVPQTSDVQSRSEIDLRMPFGKNSHLSFPVIAAPMDTVCEEDMAVAIAKAGGLGMIHRFMDISKQQRIVQNLCLQGLAVGASVGAKGTYLEDTGKLLLSGASAILVDTANGHSSYAVEAVKKIRDTFGSNFHLMAGNVSTKFGFQALSEAGADSVRVGIGGGSVCTTRLVSGHGVPTLASVIEIKEWKENNGIQTSIVADGGIRNTGDMIKAFAAGADAVMLGSMLAGTDESPGSIRIDETGKYKNFRGMASKEANEGKDVPIAEGVATRVPYKGSVNDILANIRGGLGSGCSYSGEHNLRDLYSGSMYIEVSSISVNESRPHALG